MLFSATICAMRGKVMLRFDGGVLAGSCHCCG